ncbi:MAG: glycoside hydrolase 5 family protein [Planctomycetota bacterium]|jgi:hypothetical protein
MSHDKNKGFKVVIIIHVVIATAFSLNIPTQAADSSAKILKSGLPGEDPGLIEALGAELGEAGYQVSKIDIAGICDSDQVTTDKFDLLILPNAGTLPADSVKPIENFVQNGGDIIALKSPMWGEPMFKVQDRWLTRTQCRRAQSGALPDHMVLDFSPDDVEGWDRHCFDEDSAITYETVAEGPAPQTRALHVLIADLREYDTIGPFKLDNPFAEGNTLTVFSAKGGPGTTQVCVEWREKDESRWIAVIPLSQKWQQYVLSPEDFRFWEGPAERTETQFEPGNARRVMFGMSFAHNGPIGGRHEFWVGPYGTAKMKPEYRQCFSRFDLPVWDTLSPDYMLFTSSDVRMLMTHRSHLLTGQDSYEVPNQIRSPHPRPSGAGFDKRRDWRWIPLIEAYAPDGDWRGAPATLLAHADGQFKGGIWASFGIQDNNWYQSPTVMKDVGRVARWMKQGIFIVDGGATFYTYLEDQEIKFGIRAANVGKETASQLMGRITLIDNFPNHEIIRKEWPLALKSGEVKTVSDSWKPGVWLESGFTITAELVLEDKVIDSVTHLINLWKPKPKKQYITVKDGDFMLAGARWRANGVNYMPSSGIATEDYDYFNKWLGVEAYDPEIIGRDLLKILELGFNAVSIFVYHENLESQNLLDVLRRLDNLGLKVNLSLRPGSPMNFDWPTVRTMIESYRLWEFDVIFAYDLDWEPVFDHQYRYRYDRLWREWIVERYGSIDNAEKDWGVGVPKDDLGNIISPSAEQVFEDGEWRKMVAAYRRFLDTLLYKKYSGARRLVRSIDPYHLVSFRMNKAGDPTAVDEGYMLYDFPYLAGAVDFLAPEAYGRLGDWEKIKPGWFTCDYARWADPDKPMIWAEIGFDAWDPCYGRTEKHRLDFQGQFYSDIYRMLTGSGADGVFFWWYPGGFRYYESSDYGIINPDGTDRPVTKVIQEYGPQHLNGPPARTIDHWIAFDRDAHAAGMPGEYDRIKDEYFKAIDAGGGPGLKTAGTGTTSADCPLLAVGNTAGNGSNPPKYLDGAFDSVEVQDDRGKWVAVEKGGRVKINPAHPVIARVELTNLGEARWLAPQTNKMDTGAVYITARSSNVINTKLSSPVKHLQSIKGQKVALAPVGLADSIQVTISLMAEGRTPFGEKFTIQLVP